MDRAGDEGRLDLIVTFAHTESNSGSSKLERLRTQISFALFPASKRLTRRELIVVSALSLVLFIGSFVLLLGWRVTPSAADILWAEDGTTFMHDAASMPYLDALFTPYAGYAHILPRTLAALIETLPAEHWALGVALSSITVRSAIAIFVWHASSGAIPSKLARATISASVVTLPMGGFEVLNSLANLHWFLIFACLPAIVWRPTTWFGIVVQSAVVVAAVLSDPIALLWSPIVLLRMISLKRPSEQIVCAAYVGAALIQVGIVLSSSRPRQSGWGTWDLIEAYAVRVVQTTFAGTAFPAWLWQSARLVGVLVTLGLFVWVITAGLIRVGPHRGLIVCSTLASVGFYTFSLSISVPAAVLLTDYGTIDLAVGGRYAVPSALLLFTAVVASLWAIVHEAGSPQPLVIACISGLVVLYSCGVILDYGQKVEPAAPQTWTEAVETAVDVCLDPAQGQAVLPVYPSGWTLTLSCEAFRG